MPVPKGYRHKKLASAKSCAAGSFRRVQRNGVLITICCPKGHWKRRRCNVGTRAIGLDKPRGFGGTKLPRGAYHPAAGDEIPYTVFRQSKDYLYGWNWTRDGTTERGLGYRTKASALDAAVKHLLTERK